MRIQKEYSGQICIARDKKPIRDQLKMLSLLNAPG